jgi:hypothetical protein
MEEKNIIYIYIYVYPYYAGVYPYFAGVNIYDAIYIYIYIYILGGSSVNFNIMIYGRKNKCCNLMYWSN